MTSTLRSESNVYLIGHYHSQITGSKLPSIGQILRVMFYAMRCVKLNVRESARLAIKEAMIFWEKARIPTQADFKCISKLEKIYHEWNSMKKRMNDNSNTQKQKENAFKEKLNDLFDIIFDSTTTKRSPRLYDGHGFEVCWYGTAQNGTKKKRN